jgi:hypothetical protein
MDEWKAEKWRDLDCRINFLMTANSDRDFLISDSIFVNAFLTPELFAELNGSEKRYKTKQ